MYLNFIMQEIKTAIPDLKEFIGQNLSIVKNARYSKAFMETEELLYAQLIDEQNRKAREEIKKARELLKEHNRKKIMRLYLNPGKAFFLLLAKLKLWKR